MLKKRTKIAAVSLFCTYLMLGTALAAPVKNLEIGDLNVDFMIHNSNDSGSNYNFDYKITHSLTVGFEKSNWRSAGYKATETYAQFNFGPSSRFIVGNVSMDSHSKPFWGGATGGILNEDWDYYASQVIGSHFRESQVGLNYKLTDDLKTNFTYRISKFNDKKCDGFYWGLSYRFNIGGIDKENDGDDSEVMLGI
jgi:opacity protein-like surface antigen